MPLIAKWIFDGEFNRIQKKIGKDLDYIGQDWAQGGAKATEKIKNGNFKAGENYWSFSTASDLNHSINRNILTIGKATSGIGFRQNNTIKDNTFYKISFKVRAISGTSSILLGLQWDADKWIGKTIYSTDTDWQEINIYGYTGIVNSTKIFDSWFNGDITIEITNISVKEISNGHHLLFSNGFDYKNQLTGQSPIFKGGNGLRHDGVNDYSFIPAAQATIFYPRNGDFSLIGRIRTGNDVMSTQKIYMIGNASPGKHFLQVYIASGYIYFDVSTTEWPAWVSGNTFRYPVISNEYYHFALIIDRDGEQSLWINGQKVVSQNVVNTNDLFDSGSGLKIGKHESDSSYFNGHMIELDYFNHALSEQEIQELYGLATGWYSHNFVSGTKYKNNDFKQYISFPAGASNSIRRDVKLSKTGDFTLEYLATSASGTRIRVYEKSSGTVLKAVSIVAGSVQKQNFTTSEKEIILEIAANGNDFPMSVELDYVKIY